MNSEVMPLVEYKGKLYLSSVTLAKELDREHRFVVAQLSRVAQEQQLYPTKAELSFLEYDVPHERNGTPAKHYLLDEAAAVLYAQRLRPTDLRGPLATKIKKSFKGEE